MKRTAEKRFFAAAELRIKANEDGTESGTIAGNAIVYDSPSENFGGWVEAIKPGAFTESLKTADVRALIDHDPSLILGRNVAGTLRLVDGPQALAFEIDPPDTSYARDLMPSIRRKDKTGCSFGMICLEDAWTPLPGDNLLALRTIIRAEIFDVSIVTYPAYPDTSVALRSLDQYRQSLTHQASAQVSRLLRARFDLADRRRR